MIKTYVYAAIVGVFAATLKFYLQPNFKITESPIVMSSKAYPAAFQVNVISNVLAPITANKEFTLTATVHMPQGSGSFEFMWWLPESVQIISGQVDPTLTFNANGYAETKITLRLPLDNKNYQIDAEAYRINSNGEVQGYIKQFNTNPALLNSATVLPILKKHRIVH